MRGNFAKNRLSPGKSFCLRKPNAPTPIIGNIPAILHLFTEVNFICSENDWSSKIYGKFIKIFAVSQLT